VEGPSAGLCWAMPTLLGIDVGSSSVIAGILRGTTVLKESPRAFFTSRCEGARVDVDPETLLAAVKKAVEGLGEDARKVDAVALAVMCPAWVAMDKNGRALTPIVTHQDRRSVEIARDIEARFGKDRHLNLVGCRPFPGGISSTTWAWFRKHEPARLRKADLVGHLNTFLHRNLTGARVIDPSNASFTGLYETIKLGGWSEELCANIGVSSSLLPDILDADRIAGVVTPEAARAFGLREGTPVMTGIVDGSAGMLLAGAKVGQLFNVCGSTDVLALCTDRPRPHERLLTRALGVQNKFLAVGTLAAVASAIYWMRDQFFQGMSIDDFREEFRRLAKAGPSASGTVHFEPYMAGERTSIEQRQGAFTGLTLASNRTHMLSAVMEGLIAASAARLPLLKATGTPILPTVVISGGSDRLDALLRRDWPGKWKVKAVTDATMRGLGTLKPKA
jgi:xylulokinase